MNKIRFILTIFSTIIFIIFSTGCEEKSKTDVAKVHWDRDMCARCVMVVSDRKNTVQVRDPATGRKYMFDDIGCMILWFKDQNIQWKDKAVIWITDVDTGLWIDAKIAFYDTENITPMAYGFSAHKTKEAIKKNQEIIDFQEVTKRVIKIGK
jgi:nitrous oxide reductase accessory protein NosL